MSLLDHFHPPLKPCRSWHGFYTAWATNIAADLNCHLPTLFYAEPNVSFNHEIDGDYYDPPDVRPGEKKCESWQPPDPDQNVPLAIVTDLAEVLIFNHDAGPVLVGVIVLASPSNKMDDARREAFVSKSAAYLQQGLGLLLVDVVTERRANLHDALLQRVSPGAAGWGVDLYAASYHPVGQNGHSKLDLWREELRVGQPLPILPLWLRGGLCLPLDLDTTYQLACRKLRLV